MLRGSLVSKCHVENKLYLISCYLKPNLFSQNNLLPFLKLLSDELETLTLLLAIFHKLL